MPPLNPLLHCIFLLPRTSQRCTRAFCFVGSLCNVPIIHLNPLRWLQKSHQTVSEDCYVRVLPSGVGAVDPLDVPLENAKINLIAKSRFALELVGGKERASLRDSAVGAVNTQMGVPIRVDLPVMKRNLKRNMLER